MSNLDDFFSKRDKKKKTTKKFTTLDANEFAKQLEATSSRLDDDGDNQNDSERNNNLNSNDNMDEEWRPFESDENRDLTGLKIVQNWKADDRDSNYYGGLDDGDKKPEFKWGSSKPTDETNKTTNEADDEKTSTTAAPAAETTEKPPQEKAEADAETESAEEKKESSDSAPTATTGAYIPPALRRQQQSTAESDAAPKSESSSSSTTATSAAAPSKYIPPHLRKAGDSAQSSSSSSSSSAIPVTSVNYRKPNKAQPNINDTLEFPTLDNFDTSSGKPEAGNEKFEIPKKGGRIEPKSNESSINLDNKFNALSTKN